MKNRLFAVLIFSTLPLMALCTVKPPEITITGEKTVLERQLLGEYRFPNNNIFLPSADGGIYLKGISPLSDTLGGIQTEEVSLESSRREYLIALANHRFNLEDIEKFKDMGIVGENNRGYLHIFENKISDLSPADRAVLKEVVSEENEGRKIIMNRLISLRADLSEKDMHQIEGVFAQRNFDNEKPGRIVQSRNGEWIIKK